MYKTDIILVTKVLAYSALFIFGFSIYIFNNILYAITSTIIYIVGAKLIESFYLMNEDNEELYNSFINISKLLKERLNDRFFSEIEVDRYGVYLRIFILKADENEIKYTLKFINNYLKENDKTILFQSLQVVSIEKKNDISEARKVLQAKIKQEREKIS